MNVDRVADDDVTNGAEGGDADGYDDDGDGTRLLTPIFKTLPSRNGR